MKKPKLFFLERGRHGKMRFSGKKRNYTTVFLYTFIACVGVFFLILTLRLFQLTIVKGSYYRNLSEDNRVREIIVESERGSILDRNGYVLAKNKSVDVDLPEDRITSHRVYQDPETYAHILGYRQRANTDDIQNDACLTKLQLGDKVGKKGVERLYDCILRGKNGKKLIEINAVGEELQTLSVIDPIPGQDITLALDHDLQKKAYEALGKQKGVVVALQPDTGEVLAMASWPTYNIQDFEDDISKQVERYFADKDKPMFNRVTEGTYPPGSVYKMTVTSASLEEGAVTADTLIEDTGVLEVGPAKYHNWYYLKYGATDGQVNAVKAIQRSNDIYYYKIGGKLGPEKIKKWSQILGFEKKTGIGLSEAPGTIPSPFWKEDTLGEDWYTGDTYNMSIGQGYTLVTPLQIAMNTAIFANGGNLCQPQLLRLGENSDIEDLANIQAACTKVPLTQNTLDVVLEGMIKVCQPGGTGTPFFDMRVRDPAWLAQVTPTPTPGEDSLSQSKVSSASAEFAHSRSLPVACKTGTAESFGPDADPHAWFTIFAPAENPQIVLTVLVENGGEGSEVAAPIAKEILQWWFERL